MIKITDIHGKEWGINPNKIVGFKVRNEPTLNPIGEKEGGYLFVNDLTTIVFVTNSVEAAFHGDIRDKLITTEGK